MPRSPPKGSPAAGRGAPALKPAAAVGGRREGRAALGGGFPLDRAVPVLLDWFQRERRDLPWRRAPAPYAVWVSEMMLQQTQVATVVPYFERWMRRFPTVKALAAAREEEVLQQWAGLGYYARARALHRAARRVATELGGELPRSAQALRQLPGIGPYTAGAIASIAFGEREPVVDGNVARVLARWLAAAGDPRRDPLRSALWSTARRAVALGEAGEVNQALMELGALVCTPRIPRCESCPVEVHCRAREAGVVHLYPERTPRPAVRELVMAAAVVWRGTLVLTVRAAPTAQWWAGLWHFPFAEVGSGERPASAAARAARAHLGSSVPEGAHRLDVGHAVTRYRITLSVFEGRLDDDLPRERQVGRAWRRLGELARLPMPAPHRRVAQSLLEG